VPGQHVVRRECDARAADPAEYDPRRVAWARAGRWLTRDLEAYAESGTDARADEEDSCTRKKRLSDQLLGAPDEAGRLAAARAAAARVKARALERLREICAARENGLRDEGARAAGVDAIVAGFLGCEDVGPSSPACESRRSYGWVLCRAYQQRAADRNSERLRQIYTSMFMAAGGALALVATFGGAGVVAAVLGIGLTGTGMAIEIPAHYREIRDAQRARVDFHNRWRDYDGFRRQWEMMEDNDRHFWAWQAFNVLALGLDAAAIRGALVAAREGRLAMNLDELIRSGRAEEAFEAAGRLGRGAAAAGEDILPELRRIGGSRLADEYVGAVRERLVAAYGRAAREIADETDVLRLARLEERMETLVREGRLTAAQVEKLRTRVTRNLARACVR
jgi:hypothetical protein